MTHLSSDYNSWLEESEERATSNQLFCFFFGGGGVVVGAGWCFYGGCRRLSGEVNCGHLQDGDRSSGRGLVEVVLVV